MNIHKYQIFSTVVELGSLTKTAQTLNLTQSVVSHVISSLESDSYKSLLLCRLQDAIQMCRRFGNKRIYNLVSNTV